MTRETTPLDAMGSLRRTQMCGQIGNDQVGQEVVLAGWVNRRRDHGGVIFVDLRDRTGIVQIVFKPEVEPEAHERAGLVRNEFVLMVRGVLENRSDETINEKMKSGRVEMNVHELRLLNTATPPPFMI
ncbi:MAG: aspartate--tRNA ligase, partial [bacterium]|nr:aspartate--tRNA ligase [bacterium]